MELILKRVANVPRSGARAGYTIGHLYVSGTYFCDTLEDQDRGLCSDWPVDQIRKYKVPGETAIPTGRYCVRCDIQSPRLVQREFYRNECCGYVPRLMAVPGYEGILIHAGNTDRDTMGCLLVGYNRIVGKVINSQACWKLLYKQLKSAAREGEEIWITLTRCYEV